MPKISTAAQELQQALQSWNQRSADAYHENADRQNGSRETLEAFILEALQAITACTYLGRSTVDARVLFIDTECGAATPSAAVVNSTAGAVDARVEDCKQKLAALTAAQKRFEQASAAIVVDAQTAKTDLLKIGSSPTDGGPKPSGSPTQGGPKPSGNPNPGPTDKGGAAPTQGGTPQGGSSQAKPADKPKDGGEKK
jgi:hypothetical protein